MPENPASSLDSGTYEILRNRLRAHSGELSARLDKLNEARKEAFGAVETKLVASRRITTANNCVPRDLVALGNTFLFGYNVQFGLKSTVSVSDVFSVYTLEGEELVERDLGLIEDERFREHFADLYKYYKNTVFAKFLTLGPNLFMGFRVGKAVEDVKTFKWLAKEGALTYLDNRSDHEFRFPTQHEFDWKRTHRDMHKQGRHPHVSIEDRVFVETVGGDLTIKIENNTDTGEGILAEKVSHKDQTLDDGEFFYAIVEPLILLRIRPYQEEAYRYFVYNDKLKTAQRLDAICNSCVRLPDSHGLIFANGYCLHTGETKVFDHPVEGMLFERRIVAPNGEDYLYVFYNRETGIYILLSYNIISQQVDTPILCNGFSMFPDGRMLLLRAEREPQKHHMAQLWQTPYVSETYSPPKQGDTPLSRIGNKDIVRAMAECREIEKLIAKEEPYELLYADLAKRANDLIDSYHWIGDEATFNLREVLQEIREAARAAVAEFEKVTRQRRHARESVATVATKTGDLLSAAQRRQYQSVDEFVESLASLRAIRGEIIALRDLRYADLERIELLENDVAARAEELSHRAVEFLLGDEALAPYAARIEEESSRIDTIGKAAEATEMEGRIAETAAQLDLLIDIVSNLKIDDPTKTSKIIEGISAVYSRLNQVRAGVRNRKRSLMSEEGVAEFAAQIKLLAQGVVNYLDISDTPDKCDEYLNKLLVQIEGLEGRFADFDDFVLQLAEKRTEVQAAFEARKLALLEERNRRALAQQSAADRILKGVRHRAESMKTVEEINGYFATDLMIDKVRQIVETLTKLGDSVKADEIATRLKTIREGAVRQLKDRQELFVDGQNVIRFGKHQFSVNTQELDLTIVPREGEMYIHISGTNFFDRIADPAFLETRPVWNQDIVSETAEVYRAEYLAHMLHRSAGRDEVPTVSDLTAMNPEELLAVVQRFMAPRYQEGYVKGVHDNDGAAILGALLRLLGGAGLLRYRSAARTLAMTWWLLFAGEGEKAPLERRLRGLGSAMARFARGVETDHHIARLSETLAKWSSETGLFKEDDATEAAEFLFHHLCTGDGTFPVHREAAALAERFATEIGRRMLRTEFEKSLAIENDPAARVEIARGWLSGFASEAGLDASVYTSEAALTLIAPDKALVPTETETTVRVEGLLGAHGLVSNGVYTLDLPDFLTRLRRHSAEIAPRFVRFQEFKKEYLEKARRELRTEEFKPRVLTSFVRNRMIDTVYLPLIGDNLAKQMGTVGENRRTDRMGMLLLISPPGYGKTTLMEYIAHRLGLIFMKINGPSIGHEVTAIDPANAPNAGAREELEKLNLSFEMGDNVMIYLDDIQHLNPEFLQKFISLCDGQRKIEGVFRGRSRTYDLRGRKVCVVMAGNPYTESGQKFKIPDMLANRADTYNLGDIIGNSREAFELSYIENALTSNAALNVLTTRSQKDVYAFIRLADTGSREGVEFEGNYSAEETNEIVAVLQKMRRIQRVILTVNQEYIRSAGQADEYRTEPPFKLQGSYRNMNRLAEKVVPVMNDGELDDLVRSHYEGESQNLTAEAEANLLKFKELVGWLTEKEAARWNEIKEGFRRANRFRGVGADDRMGQMLVQLGDFGKNFTEIRDALGSVAGEISKPRETIKLPPPPPPMPEQIRTELAAETMRRLELVFNQLRFAMAASRPVIVTANVPPGPPQLDAEGAPIPTNLETLGRWLAEEEYEVEERIAGVMSIQREGEIAILLRSGGDRLHFQADAGRIPAALARHIYRELLVLNTQILPVSVGIDRQGPEDHRLVVLESRDLAGLGKLEFLGVLHTFQSGVEAAKALLEGLLQQAGEEE